MKTDAEIKKAVLDSIKWNSTIQEGRVTVSVKNGWVTLTGNVDWQYQKLKSKLLAGDCIGAAGVTDFITVSSAFDTLWIIKESFLPDRPSL
ncbi:MAG TPA: BON domain-containing protein [Bacteroidia bacterium]|jgi:osmotically-inducible protein OsmY|nr:BON domain-containing protein [Bacteroidia bacterium]